MAVLNSTAHLVAPSDEAAKLEWRFSLRPNLLVKVAVAVLHDYMNVIAVNYFRDCH